MRTLLDPNCGLADTNALYAAGTSQGGYGVIGINECSSNPCQNGGVCFDYLNYFVCECTVDYTDTYCDINLQIWIIMQRFNGLLNLQVGTESECTNMRACTVGARCGRQPVAHCRRHPLHRRHRLVTEQQ